MKENNTFRACVINNDGNCTLLCTMPDCRGTVVDGEVVCPCVAEIEARKRAPDRKARLQ
jgi:hypothetical protein